MRRIIAASVGLVLALVGAFLVINYARNADERAASGLKTQPVIVAVEAMKAGTPASEFGDRVEIKQVPGSVAVTDAVASLDDIDSLVLTADVVPGEQLTRSRFATTEDLRARGDVALPEELANHHQVTILLEKARALGGDIAPGTPLACSCRSTSTQTRTRRDSSRQDRRGTTARR